MVVTVLSEVCGEITMGRTIAYVGVPTSLGSYGPGQEKAPQAFRDAGFPQMLREEGLTASTADGALDWMGVAHMLGLNGAIPQLANCGPRYPLISPAQVYLLGFDPDSATEWERSSIRDRAIATSHLPDVAQSPV